MRPSPYIVLTDQWQQSGLMGLHVIEDMGSCPYKVTNDCEWSDVFSESLLLYFFTFYFFVITILYYTNVTYKNNPLLY